MAVRQGTTHTIPIRYGGVIESDFHIIVTFTQLGKELEKSTKGANPDVWFEPIYKKGVQIATRIVVKLSQKETLYFDSGRVSIQLRWINEEEIAGASRIIQEEWKAVLKRKVITYD